MVEGALPEGGLVAMLFLSEAKLFCLAFNSFVFFFMYSIEIIREMSSMDPLTSLARRRMSSLSRCIRRICPSTDTG